MEGYILLHRKMSENPLYLSEPFNRALAWIDLLLLANYRENYFYVRGVKVKVNRGQLGWGLEKLSTRWKWSRGKVERFLNDLETEKQIVRQKNNVTTLISIVKYEDYQTNSKADSKANDKADSKADRHIRSKDNKVKESIYMTDFNLFWTKYPKKTGKGAAFSSWKKLTKHEKQKIDSALDWQILSDQWLKDSGQYIPNPQTYLNQKRFDDEPTKIRKMTNQVYN